MGGRDLVLEIERRARTEFLLVLFGVVDEAGAETDLLEGRAVDGIGGGPGGDQRCLRGTMGRGLRQAAFGALGGGPTQGGSWVGGGSKPKDPINRGTKKTLKH